jgi:hypothetical protein
MSDKDRQKKDGQDKNKKNQRQRAAKSDSVIKKNTSTAMNDQDQPPRRPAPAEARTHASKAMKGK